MPPKKGASKKAEQAKQAKIIEDKTFGLKNKNKSKKVQQFVKQVQQQVKQRGRDHKTIKKEEEEKAAKLLLKQAKEQKDKEISSLFKAVADVKQVQLKQGEDPKSVLCAYFKAGSCVRGDKCKFSHDMGLVRKSGKLNVYADPRQEDTMDKWDQSKLEQVIAEKHNARPNQTEIICKYFLDAIENSKYGWFWQCPNGDTCIYRHALPLGYVFTNKAQKEESKEDQTPIEELIEEERARLDHHTLTPVNPETFAAWKERRRKKREEEVEIQRKEAEKKHGGKGIGVLSGRSLFIYDPSLFVDDDEAAGQDSYELLGSIEEEKQERHAPDEDAAAAVNDASLFLDEDVELPEDEEENNGDENDDENAEENENEDENEAEDDEQQ